MDNSQSSDVFSDFTSRSCNSASNIIDLENYDSLINTIKASLTKDVSAMAKSSFANFFTSLLEDCQACISQTLKIISETLLDTHIHAQKLSQYMDGAVSILKMFSNFIKNIIESVAMNCCTMKTFPTITGQIIMDVFMHCRNSETVYGVHLTTVEQHLKDLFRSCQELQLNYLTVLEKHFVLNLTELEELELLVEALKINLLIGEVVQALDVKTMADQWKSYTSICEKYSNCLMDKSVFQDCSELLCTMIFKNIKTAVEVEQDEKLTVRLMKVTNFIIKILIKMNTIFKHSKSKPYQLFVDLLVYVYLNSPAYLETVEEKSVQFGNIISINVFNSTELLLKELICDQKFVNVVVSSCEENKLNQDNKWLGFLCLIAKIMELASQKSEQVTLKDKIITTLFKCLPECECKKCYLLYSLVTGYIYFNIGLKFKIDGSGQPMKSVGLFEYLLVIAARLTLTMDSKEMCVLEKLMFEAILGVDSHTALFASNLWTTVARAIDNEHFLLTQLTNLCETYQKLETVKLFSQSPQKVHLAATMSGLFESLSDKDRMIIYKKFDPLIHNKNVSLWGVLKIRSLPKEFQKNVAQDAVDTFKAEYRKFTTGVPYGNPYQLIKITNLLSTCAYHTLEDLEDCLMESWAMACPNNLAFVTDTFDMKTIWFFEYIEALVGLTYATDYVAVYGKSSNVVKILHVISGLTQLGNTELKLLLMDLLCKLAVNPIHDNNKLEAGNITADTFKTLIQDSDVLVRNKFLWVVRTYDSKYLDQIVFSIVCGNVHLLQAWKSSKQQGKTEQTDCKKLIEQLSRIRDFKYQHKCVEFKQNVGLDDKVQNSCSSNFDLADIDTLFDNESDCEPASKKVKLDTTEVETILSRLEENTMLLCDIKENVFTEEHRKKIKCLYEKLKSIVT